MFDISGTGHSIQIGWTAANSSNAFLALPGADGIVHDGKQLLATSRRSLPPTIAMDSQRSRFMTIRRWWETATA